jgi:two-component system, cell cycle sensor histidine kinase and response regulator CckA
MCASRWLEPGFSILRWQVGCSCDEKMDTVTMKADRILGKRILLVEDERLVRESIGRLLAKDDHTVVEANNGAEAFSLFTSGQYDLVMTDFEIPFLKGNELASRIKRLAPAQPILMITAHGKRPGPDNPVDAVLNKPVSLDHLRKAMAGLLSEAEESFTA